MLSEFELDKYIRTCAGRAGLNVTYEDKVAPRTDGQTIYLPRPDAIRMSECDAEDIRHFVAHEVSHILFSNFDVKDRPTSGSQGLHGFIANILEDNRVDYLNGQRYLGDSEDANAYLTRYVNRLDKKFKAVSRSEAAASPVSSGGYTLSDAAVVLALDFAARSGSASVLGLQFALRLADPVKADKAMKFVPELVKAREDPSMAGSTAMLDLSDRVLKEVFGQTPQPLESTSQKGKKSSSGNGSGQSGSGSGVSAEGDGSGEDGHGGDDDSGSDERGTDKKERSVRWEDLSAHAEHAPSGITRSPLHIDYSGYTAGDAWPPSPPTVTSRSTLLDRIAASIRRDESLEWMKKYRRAADGFAAKVRKRLQIRARDRRMYGQTSGRLHTGSLHRVVLDGCPEVQSRIFKKRIKSEVLDAAVTVLVDHSGSMGGSKIAHAAVAMGLLNETIGNTLHVPLEILGFTYDTGTWISNYRSHSEPRVSTEQVIKALGISCARMMASNADGEAIMYAFERLRQRKEKKKLLIVLSDGQPAAYHPRHVEADIVRYTQDVIKKIEQVPGVLIVGVGIQTKSVVSLYKHSRVIADSAELENSLLSLIDEAL